MPSPLNVDVPRLSREPRLMIQGPAVKPTGVAPNHQAKVEPPQERTTPQPADVKASTAETQREKQSLESVGTSRTTVDAVVGNTQALPPHGSVKANPVLMHKLRNAAFDAGKLAAFDATDAKTNKIDAIKQGLKADPIHITEKQAVVLAHVHLRRLEEYRAAAQNGEPLRKVIPDGDLESYVGMKYGAPSLGGFFARGKYSEGLSAQQVISQFGLDYGKAGNATPFLDAGDRPKDTVFYLETKATKELVDQIRVPVDTQVIKTLEEVAKRPVTPTTLLAARKDIHAARDFLKHVQEVARSGGDERSKIVDEAQKNKVRVNDPPYTGTGVPAFGVRLEKDPNAYAVIAQEFIPAGDKRVGLSSGTSVVLLRNTNPPFTLATYDGKVWQPTVSQESDLPKWLSEDERKTLLSRVRNAAQAGADKVNQSAPRS